MWHQTSRIADAAVTGGDVKVSLPPQLDLRDRRFQIGSAAAIPRSSSYSSGDHSPAGASLLAGPRPGVADDVNQQQQGPSLSASLSYKLKLPQQSTSAPSLTLKHSHSSSSSSSLSSSSSSSPPPPQPPPPTQQSQPPPPPTTSAQGPKTDDRGPTPSPTTGDPKPSSASNKPPQEHPRTGRKEDRRLNKLRRRARTMEPPVLSFYGAHPVPLQPRFATIKRRLIAGHEKEVSASWARLIVALNAEMAAIREKTSSLELMGAIDYADIEDPQRIAEFSNLVRRFGVGVVRGVVPPQDAEAWVEETRRYLETKHDIKPPPPQDPTCFDFFWTPAQIRARAHPHVLRAMKFAMGLWDSTAEDRMATRFPITYADRIRIHVNSHAAAQPDATGTTASGSAAAAAAAAAAATAVAVAVAQEAPTVPAPAESSVMAAAETSGTIIAQVDGGSLERWEPDGYGRSGTYDSIFRGEWEAYDPWDATGRISATPDLYNGAGACSIFRMFQGLLALTQVQPGMIRLLPSPKLVTAYFLLRPFFSPKNPAPEGEHEGPEWEAFLHPDNWELDSEQSTIIHGAVPGHAQRVTELWHPHLDLKRTLVTPPDLQAGDYIIWHFETAYTITSSTVGGSTSTEAAAAATAADAPRHERFMVYAPACPLTQTNALYLARQRKNFLRGHPGPDFDSTGTGLGTEAPHVGRLGEKEIREVGGEEGLRAMGLAPWDSRSGSGGESDYGSSAVEEGKRSDKMEIDDDEDDDDKGALSAAETELVRLANIILFPDKYEFYMATRNSSPDGGKEKELN